MTADSQWSWYAHILDYLFGHWIPNCVCKTWKKTDGSLGKSNEND
jgi:hypothetical protein